MKIRTNYVSNSSSSSFLVIYHDMNDFKNFAPFKGYDTFINDIKDVPEKEGYKNALTHIEDVLGQEVSNIESQIMFNSDYERYSPLNQLIFEDGLFKDYDQFTKPIDEFRSKAIDLSDSESAKTDRFDLWRELHKIEPDYCKIAKKMHKWLKDAGWKMATVEYCDECDYGAYMEHQFMPFMASNPEREYHIVQLSKH